MNASAWTAAGIFFNTADLPVVLESLRRSLYKKETRMKRERRRQRRYESNMFAAFSSVGYGDPMGRGVVTDVSLGGFGVETESTLPLGGEVYCNVEIPFQVKIRVVSQQTAGQRRRYGVQFMEMGLLDRMLLKRAIRRGLFTKKVF